MLFAFLLAPFPSRAASAIFRDRSVHLPPHIQNIAQSALHRAPVLAPFFSSILRRSLSFPAEFAPGFAKRSIRALPVSFRFPQAYSLPRSKAAAARGRAAQSRRAPRQAPPEITLYICLCADLPPAGPSCPPVRAHGPRRLAHRGIRIASQHAPHQCAAAPAQPAATSSTNFARENSGTATALPFFRLPIRTAPRTANPPVRVLPRRPRSPAKSPLPPNANTAGTSRQRIPMLFPAPPRTLAP